MVRFSSQMVLLKVMKKNTVWLFILLCCYACDRKLREAEKIYDKLELDIPAHELVDKLDLLENSIPEKYYISINSGGIRFNRNRDFIESKDINTEFLSESPITKNIFSLEEIDNIVEIYKVIIRNKIRIQDFTLDYACNGQTNFFYKFDLCGSNSYCERKLYIRKGDTIDFDCFNGLNNDLLPEHLDDMAPIDSIGNIYLLKPVRYF